MKINEILAEAGALGSLLRGAGATQAAAAADAYSLAQQRNPQATKPQPQTEPTSANQSRVLPTIITATGQKIVKRPDGKWYRPNNNPITDANEIKRLNQMVVSAEQTAIARGEPAPTVIRAQYYRPTVTDESYSIGGQQLASTKPGDKTIIDILKADRS